jgi:hypothetical protein
MGQSCRSQGFVLRHCRLSGPGWVRPEVGAMPVEGPCASTHGLTIGAQPYQAPFYARRRALCFDTTSTQTCCERPWAMPVEGPCAATQAPECSEACHARRRALCFDTHTDDRMQQSRQECYARRMALCFDTIPSPEKEYFRCAGTRMTIW